MKARARGHARVGASSALGVGIEIYLRESGPFAASEFACCRSTCSRVSADREVRDFPWTVSSRGYPARSRVCCSVFHDPSRRFPFHRTDQQRDAVKILCWSGNSIVTVSPCTRRHIGTRTPRHRCPPRPPRDNDNETITEIKKYPLKMSKNAMTKN